MNKSLKDENVLIDTSVWMAYLGKESSVLSDKVDEIIHRNTVYVPKIVIAELIQRASSDREINIIEDFVDAFRIIDHKDDAWIKAGHLLHAIKKKGAKVYLRDCYISVIAQDYDCCIFSLNGSFKSIKSVTNISLIDLESDV